MNFIYIFFFADELATGSTSGKQLLKGLPGHQTLFQLRTKQD